MQSRTLLVLAFLLAACGDDDGAPPPDPDPVRWTCPEQWVEHGAGGCGPAVFLCGTDGRGTVEDCATEDLSVPRVVREGDEIGSTFWIAPDGTLAGGWPQPTEGPPDRYRDGALVDNWEPPMALITTCPEGWTPTGDACDPALSAACPAGSGAVPGGGCTLTADADCPATIYPAFDPADGVAVHVHPSGDDATADGSEALPFRTITAALAYAETLGGAIVLVAAGTYEEAVRLSGATRLLGACAARVIIDSTALALTPTVEVPSGSVVLRGVTLRSAFEGLRISGGTASVGSVAILDATGDAVSARGAGTTALLDGLSIRGSRPYADGSGGRGVHVSADANVTLRESEVVDARTHGIGVDGPGSMLVVEGSRIAATREGLLGDFGHGVDVREGATATIRTTIIEDNRRAGVFADLPGSTVELEDVVVRGTRVMGEGTAGTGLEARMGSRLTARRVLVEDVVGFGIDVSNTGSMMELEEVVVRDVMPAGGAGIGVYVGADLTATRLRVERTIGAGVMAISEASARLEATWIRDVVAGADGQPGAGLHVEGPATVEASDLRIDGAEDVGLTVRGTDASFRGDRMVIHGSDLKPLGLARGIEATGGATLVVQHTLIAGGPGTGLRVDGSGTVADFDDGIVAGTGALGVGVTDGAALTVRRSTIEDVTGFGAVAWNMGSTLTMLDTHVARTQVGVVGFDGVVVDVRRSLIEDADDAALRAYFLGTTLRMRDVIARGSGIAALGGATVDYERVAIVDAPSAGFAALAYDGPRGAMPMVHFEGTRISGVDLYVRGAPTAYGLLAGEGASLFAQQAVVERGAWGFGTLGDLTLRTGVILSQTEAAGATSGAGVAMLDMVQLRENARDEVETADVPVPPSVPVPDLS